MRYGWRTQDIDDVVRILEAALQIEFQARDSLYLGGYYLWPPHPRDGRPEAELRLLPNFFDESDQELTYPEYPEHAVLLDAQGVGADWTAVLARLPGAEILENPPST